LTLLHPSKAVDILNTKMGEFKPKIISLNDAKVISLAELQKLAAILGDYSPEIELINTSLSSIIQVITDGKRIQNKRNIIEEDFT
jgi:hypothetical protein